MLKQLLTLLLYISLAHAAWAQAPASPSPAPVAPTLAPSRGDTIRAIGHLFERRRQGGYHWFYVSGTGVLGVIRVLASPTTTTVNGYQTKSEVDGGALATFGVVFLGIPAAVGVTKLVRFSEKRETDITAAYAAGGKLPRSVARRLRRKDF